MEISTALVTNLIFIAPFLLFLMAIAFFLVTSSIQRKKTTRRAYVEIVLKGNRPRTQGMTLEEMRQHLMKDEGEGSSLSVSMQRFFESLLKLVNFNKEETRKKLIQSGDRDPRALSRYIMQRGMGMILGPVVIYMFGIALGLGGLILVAASLVGILAGGIVVDVMLDKAISTRHQKIQAELPVLLDLLTIHLAAGAAFDVALERASRDLEVSFPTAATEIRYLRRDLEMSSDRSETLREFGVMMNTIAAKTFASIVIQAEQRGNAIAPALRNLARESRKDALIMIERKAQKIPTMMQLPMFLFILPSIFAAVIAPAIFEALSMF